MSQVDWSKAPEGSMCYVEGWGFFSCEHGEWWVSQGGSWQKTPYKSPENCSWFGDVAWRPKEWNGEGLPPVGAVCEWLDGEWVTVEIVGSYKGSAVAVAIDNPRNLYIGKSSDYRPIRAPEQVAADEREKAVNEMHDLYIEGANHRAGLYAIYDAAIAKAKGDAK